MAKAGENSEMLTCRGPVASGDIESGSIIEQVGNNVRMASPIETPLAKKDDGENYEHIEEIDCWVNSLEKILEDVPSYMFSRGHPGRISRIPENLREVDIKGYEPYIMSIGPYHHGKPSVQPMEMKKKLALKCVLQYKPELTIRDLLTEIMSIETIRDLLTEIMSIEPIARSFYSDIQMDRENFVQMLLLDGVSIVTLFCRLERSSDRMNEVNTRIESIVDNGTNATENSMNERNGAEVDNKTLEMMVRADEQNDGMSVGENWYWAMFAHDLFLIENQIPFCVIEKIHNLVYGSSPGTQFIDIMKYEVANILTYYTKQDSERVILQTEEIHHSLHLCHIFFRPTIEQESTACHFPESRQNFRLGNAVQLYEAGVHFEARSPLNYYSLLDITFDDSGKMSMPCLHVDDNTESLLRNLIALEQMKYPNFGLNVSAYIVLLLHLITNPKDVELLRRKGIIQHHLSSDKEMMYLVNRLSMGLAFDYVEDKYSLKHVFHELKRYSERRVPRWRAWLRHRHFSNPWMALSLLVASLFLLLTVVQTYYAVYSYYYPIFSDQT